MLFDFFRSGSISPRTDRHRLAGITTVDGVLAKRLVVVVDRLTMNMIVAKWSDPVTGAWEISCIPEYPERRLLVVGFDNTGTHNAEVADYVSQVTA